MLQCHFLYNAGRWEEIESGTSHTLQCPAPAGGFESRQWYKMPFEIDLLYNQTMLAGESYLQLGYTLDTQTFELTTPSVTHMDYIHACAVTTTQGATLDIIFSAVYSKSFEYSFNAFILMWSCTGVSLDYASPVESSAGPGFYKPCPGFYPAREIL